jgi:thioredoxin 1
MSKKSAFTAFVVTLIIIGALVHLSPARAKDYSPGMKIPVKGMVTMVDIGAATCIPCKMMAPILEKLDKEYKGKAAIIFLDVRFHRETAISFGINGIPTQIFYDANGKEVQRHLGYMSEAAIVAQFKKMGVE